MAKQMLINPHTARKAMSEWAMILTALLAFEREWTVEWKSSLSLGRKASSTEPSLFSSLQIRQHVEFRVKIW
jgi:hypothetical protein